MDLAYVLFGGFKVEEFLKQYRVGGAQITFGGYISTEDDRGRPTHYYVGLLWNPWDSETGRTVAAKNHVSIEGDPGPKVSIRVFSASLKDRKALEEIRPTFTNAGKKVWVWEYDQPLVVFIEGERDSESWTVSHWRMFSGRVIFDLAKNKIQLKTCAVNDDGHKPSDDLDEATKQAIAGEQLNGVEKLRGSRKSGRNQKSRTETRVS